MAWGIVVPSDGLGEANARRIDREYRDSGLRAVTGNPVGSATVSTILSKTNRLQSASEGVNSRFEQIIGTSKALQKVLDLVQTVAATNASVVIEGETGTGKELVAGAIHEHSARRDRPFVKMNCAAIPHGLLESELFGHERGAFTGAVARRIGRFETADCGTLFMDEIGDTPLDLQAKLLRVLQEGEFEKLGSTQTQRANVRLIAATNHDLKELVSRKTFRSDLYYRLNVFPIFVPALRDRPEDVPQLVRHFVAKFAAEMGKQIDDIPADAMTALVSHPWPGNVRELQNFIERSVILTPGRVLQAPLGVLRAASEAGMPKVITLEEAERRHIRETLENTHGVVAGPRGAAARLGVKRSTLYFRMHKLGITRTNKNYLSESNNGPQAGSDRPAN
jgi:formate hydrogenlyase transcriptional activator